MPKKQILARGPLSYKPLSPEDLFRELSIRYENLGMKYLEDKMDNLDLLILHARFENRNLLEQLLAELRPKCWIFNEGWLILQFANKGQAQKVFTLNSSENCILIYKEKSQYLDTTNDWLPYPEPIRKILVARRKYFKARDYANQHSGSQNKHFNADDKLAAFESQQSQSDPGAATTNRIKVLTYNVLCPEGICPQGTLKSSNQISLSKKVEPWNTRKIKIREEIKALNPGIICLQEVRNDDEGKKFLKELGDMFYHMSKPPPGVHGCSIVWNPDRYLKVHVMEHNFGESYNQIYVHGKLHERMVNRVNVALSILFQEKSTGIYFCVSTGHLFHKKKYSDVKAIQAFLWTTELWDLTNRWVMELQIPGGEMPTILCGDFNSVPGSLTHLFLTNGSIRIDKFGECGSDIRKWDQHFPSFINQTELLHKFKFKDAYEHGRLRFSLITRKLKGIIDYIFFSKCTMEIYRNLSPFPENHFKDGTVLPNQNFPSDHIPLMATMTVKRRLQEDIICRVNP